MRCVQTFSTGDLGGECRSIWTGKVRGCSLSWKGASSLVIGRCLIRVFSFKLLEFSVCTLGVNFNMSYREPLFIKRVSFLLTITDRAKKRNHVDLGKLPTDSVPTHSVGFQTSFNFFAVPLR